MNPLLALKALGQSPWLDDLQRGLLGGPLQRLIDDDGICGITSNPAILAHALLETDDYREPIARLAPQCSDTSALYEALVLEDIRSAADQLLPIHRESDGQDGLVSLEVSPELAHDATASIAEARRLWAAVDRPNLMIKIPATDAGLVAIERLVAEGLNVNATLIFSPARYRQVAEAWQRGMEQRVNGGQPAAGIASVASFFVSRIDTLADRLLQEKEREGACASTLVGQVAVAAARIAYQEFRHLRDTSAWRWIAAAGGAPQRLLWASTSTKNPAYPDTKYVDTLAGPHTVTTLPLKTLQAYRDHGRPAPRLETGIDNARAALRQLDALGIDFDAMAAQLEREGLEKFQAAWRRLLQALESARP